MFGEETFAQLRTGLRSKENPPLQKARSLDRRRGLSVTWSEKGEMSSLIRRVFAVPVMYLGYTAAELRR